MTQEHWQDRCKQTTSCYIIMISLRERKLGEVQKLCKDAGQNMFNLALAAKNSGEVVSFVINLTVAQLCLSREILLVFPLCVFFTEREATHC